MMANKTVVILFSKDRPLQCEFALHSYFYRCYDYIYNKIEDVADVKVIYRPTTDRFEKAYKILADENPDVTFILEKNFKEDLIHALTGYYDKVLFLVDDNIFVNDFCIDDMKNILNLNPESLGFSLRLGENTTYCYTMESTQDIPEFLDVYGTRFSSSLRFDWTKAQLDFGYPLELSSSFYRIEDVMGVICYTSYTSPNSLEWNMYLNLGRFQKKPYLFCYSKSVAFCAPMNKVQNVNNNKYGKMDGYDIETLLDAYEKGYRVPMYITNKFVPDACHQEFDFMREYKDEE